MMNMKEHRPLLDILLGLKQPIVIVTILLVLVGAMALVKMPRDEYPQFKIPQGIIIGVYPGATSEQVEAQVTDKVEKYLFQSKSVDRSKTYSVSKDNLMVIYIWISDNEKDPDGFYVKLQHGLNQLKTGLPSGLISLTADNDFGATSALLIAVQSDTKTYRELEAYVTELENDVRRVPSVSRVTRHGIQKEGINVYVDAAKLAQYGIKPLMLAAVLKPQSSVGYAGEWDDGKRVYPLHVPVSYKTENDLAEQIVYADPAGNVIRLKDVARVVREYEEPSFTVRVNGKKCLVVSLEMQAGNNIVQYGREVGRVIADFQRSLPADVRIEMISSIPDAVSRSIGDFMREFAIAILAVIAVTLILLPGRVALVAASAIPISVLSTIGVMWAAGMDLQTVSLAGLIVVLGLVVDNAIVIVDNYVEKLDQGLPREIAASRSVTELFLSIFSATLIIICCFYPMRFFLTGTAGDFVRSLPATVAIALSASLVVAAILIPLMSYAFIKQGVRSGKRSRKTAFLEGLQKRYDAMIEQIFRMKGLVVACGVLIFVLGVFLLSRSPLETFPKIERNQFAVEVTLPEGSSLAETDAVMKDLEALLGKDPRVKVVTAFVGTSAPRFHFMYAPPFPSRGGGQLVVLTTSNETAVEMLDEYSRTCLGRYPSAEIKWKQLEFATYVEPIEVRISGDDIALLKSSAGRVAEVLRSNPGVARVYDDYSQPLQAVDLDLKKDLAVRMGFPNAILSASLMTATRGLPAATIYEGDYPLEVRLKFGDRGQAALSEIEDLYVTSPILGTSVPVRQLAGLRPSWTEGQIVRRNGVRTLTVKAELVRGLFAAAVTKEVKPHIDRLSLPEGVRIDYGGELEAQGEYLTPFIYVLAVSVLLVFLILMFQFRNVKKSLLIMITMPLSIFGAAVGLLLTGYPLSVTALIALTALFGIVVRNGIIYAQYADELRLKENYSVAQAAVAAGKRRMRPIFLTAMAAAVGVVPMILSGSSLWGPVGSVICFGLIGALAPSLLILPVLYYFFNRHNEDLPKESEAI
jgi:multidrug efflux pump subunit AcrB